MGDLHGFGGAAAELKHLTSPAGPNPSEKWPENWAAADKVGREIIRRVQPTSVSEERRMAVIQYIQNLIKDCLGAEVFPYGSVPLKTYLPDGDIDLTVFSETCPEDILADDMKAILDEEERNTAAEFVVKDVQLIHAEVKIVKCIVQDIVVDVSFNQIGGLCTLCFLETVDRRIGKDHLFKHSIILIKAWCYYESRILGAHHGLISTYALETLVLYIFQFYHSTLDGPLAVLYKFLDFFSKFNWENYCIRLDGAFEISPKSVDPVEKPAKSDLLLSTDFLNSCVGMFSVPLRDGESQRGFQLKFFNIVDPLKEINNLGRSVSKGNYYRIRSAFSYGAKKLAQILVQPQHSIANELRKFFSNTMARHGGGPRPDVHNRRISAMPIQEISDKHAVSKGDSQCGPSACFTRKSDDLITSAIDGLKISTGSSKCQTSSPNDGGDAAPVFVPHKFFSKSKRHDSSIRNGSLDSNKLDKIENNASSSAFSGSGNQPVDKDEAVASSKTRNVFRDQKAFPDTPETLNSMDLSGDFDSYLDYLQHGRVCYEYGLGMHPLPMHPFVNPSFQSNGIWDSLQPPLHYKQNGFSHHHHHNGFHPTPLYAMQPVLLPGIQYWEDIPKPRGTGTYFPSMNVPFQGYRPPIMKGRNPVHIRAPRNSGRNMMLTEANEPSSDSYVPFSPHQNGYHNANGLYLPAEPVEEIQKPVSSSPKSSSKGKNRILLTSSYHLKDEDDFPPLSM
ncbi:hypothetical protein ACS0TY_015624 [Phlomoides rotata]